MREVWYRKVGRRYVPVAEAEKYDYQTMPPSGFTLTYREDGCTRYEYRVKPDNAGFIAAAMAARVAMEAHITEASKSTPSAAPYTAKQRALIAKFQAEMGGLRPLWWTGKSANEIAQAGIDAVIAGAAE